MTNPPFTLGAGASHSFTGIGGVQQPPSVEKTLKAELAGWKQANAGLQGKLATAEAAKAGIEQTLREEMDEWIAENVAPSSKKYAHSQGPYTTTL